MNSPELIDQLRKLWILDLVVRNECFRKAALEAKVTRSANSQTVTQLEKIHGKILLVRERGTVTATSYCTEILARARPLLRSLEELRPPSPTEEVPKMSWLDIGAYETLAIEIMPRLMRRLESQSPGIRISVRVARSGRLASMVRKGELCMAIVVENDRLEGLTVISLMKDRLGLFVSSSLVREGRKGELPVLPLGTLAAGPDGHPRYFTKFLKEAGVTKPPSFTSDSLEALLEAACFGCVIAVLPVHVANRRHDEIVEITPRSLVEKASGSHKICLVSRQNCDERENEYLAAEIRALLKENRA